MQTIPIWRYIIFGTGFRYLQDAKPGWLIFQKDGIIDVIKRFLTDIEEFKLQVTERAAYNLVLVRNELDKFGKEDVIDAEYAGKIKEVMTSIRNTLMAESKGLFAFIVTDKRIDVNKLLNDVPSLLAPKIFQSMPELAQYDFMEAGKCIAFERSTAGAFHLLRGTEGVLRAFYCSFVKRNRVKGLMWGPIVDHLRERRNKPPKPLLDNLDNIRVSFRNPTQHPELRYDIEEVQDLFNHCIDVVNRMVKIIITT